MNFSKLNKSLFLKSFLVPVTFYPVPSISQIFASLVLVLREHFVISTKTFTFLQKAANFSARIQ